MEFKSEAGKLTVCISGRIDTSNAEKAEAELASIRTANPHTALVLDLQGLEYISSVGLRFILRVKKAESDMKLINVSPEVYDIFDMTGFTDIIDVEKAFRVFSVDGCEVIGEGAKGTVYRYNGDTIVKVYKDADSLPAIKRERELAKKAFVLGIPTAISYDVVRVGESYGSVFELLDAKPFSKLIAQEPENMEKYTAMSAELLRRIHETEVKPDDMPDIKDLVWSWVKTDEPYLGRELTEKLTKLIKETPDTMNMLHCDYHVNNIMMQNGEALLIDMDTLSHGHKVFELGNVYITYVGFSEIDRTAAKKFLGLEVGVTEKMWRVFLKTYLGTDDEARFREVEDKVKIVNYTRHLRHVIRRGQAETEYGKQVVELCRTKLAELLSRVDSLDF